jgi:two-component system sensor histidine kinase KdpD
VSWRLPERPGRPTAAWLAVTVVEVVLSVAAATGLVALLQHDAPAVGLSALYLLCVMEVAVRRGPVAALLTALLSVLTLNYLFIPPHHQLAVAHSQDVVQLIVFLVAAVVVGQLAARARGRAAEAERRARLAKAREREATLLAVAASIILAGRNVDDQLQSLAVEVARATGASHARVVLESAPGAGAGELAVALKSRSRRGWLYVAGNSEWPAEDLERLAEPLGRLIDVGLEREQLAEQTADREAARRGDTARRAILHSVSHDLRSPLTGIGTAVAALRAAATTDEERQELLAGVERDVERLGRLVDDLLDLSKIEAGAVMPHADWCDLHEVVAMASDAPRRRHPIQFDVPAELPLIRADAAQLERVFSNLIDNAVRFSPGGDPVRISAGASAGRVTVRVSNRGRVIPRAERARVFEPFFRGERSGRGSGLGLAICRGFVEANGGTIYLQSDRERGTSFSVSFPVARQPEESRVR